MPRSRLFFFIFILFPSVFFAADTAASRPLPRILPVPADPKLPSLFLIGASDVRTGGGHDVWGWGERLDKYIDTSKINVVNRAIGGFGARAYITEGYWEETLGLMKPGDVLIIAFAYYPAPQLDDHAPAQGMLPGLGDETVEVVNPGNKQPEIVHTFGWYTRRLIADAQSRGVTPILCTNIVPKIWEDGKVAHGAERSDRWSAEVARTTGVAFLWLDEIISRGYDALGPIKVERFFGLGDAFHTNSVGADMNAQCLVATLKGLSDNPLRPYLTAEANDIAAFAEPAPRYEVRRPIEGDDPKITAQLTSFLESAREGRCDTTVFTPELGNRIARSLATQAGRQFAGFGPIKHVDLVGKDESAGLRTYQYRVAFAYETLLVHWGYNESGKVAVLKFRAD